jgi:hypothetical protein
VLQKKTILPWRKKKTRKKRKNLTPSMLPCAAWHSCQQSKGVSYGSRC